MRLDVAKKLAEKTFADYIMFQNSGTEATEAAIKVARRYFYSIGKPNKNRIICIKNSFHGRTIAAIHASGSKKMTEGFGPKVPGFDHFKFGDHIALKKSITKKTAAIMIEPVLGEGGIKVSPMTENRRDSSFIREINMKTNDYGIENTIMLVDLVDFKTGESKSQMLHHNQLIRHKFLLP